MNLGDLWVGEGFGPPKPSVCLLIVKLLVPELDLF